MRDFSETPPLHYSPLTSDREKSSTRENTPIGTPTLLSFPGARNGADKADYLSWHPRKSGLYLDSTLLELDKSHGDLDPDLLFPPFSSSPPLFPSSPVATMASRASPIDITRQTSTSPRGQQASNLTSALQGADGGDHHLADLNMNGSNSNGFKAAFGRQDSLSGGTLHWGNGTNPISTNSSGREKPRRESIAGSLVGGMSWGGISVGSWIRDE
jgi:transcription factor SFP1